MRQNEKEAAVLQKMVERVGTDAVTPFNVIDYFDKWMFEKGEYNINRDGWFNDSISVKHEQTWIIVAYSLASILAIENNKP